MNQRPHLRYVDLARGLVAFILLNLSATSFVIGQVAVRVPDREIESTGIVHTVSSKNEIDIKTGNLIQRFATEIWIATRKGLFVVNDQSSEINEIRDVPPDIKAIFKTDQHVWISTTDGIFRVDIENHGSKKEFTSGIEILGVTSLKDETWLLTNRGVYSVRGDLEPRPVPIAATNITFMAPVSNDEIWFGASDGVYRATLGSNLAHIHNSPKDIQCLMSSGGLVWVGSKTGIYVADSSGSFKPISLSSDTSAQESTLPYDVTSISEIYGQVGFTAGDKIYIVTEDKTRRSKSGWTISQFTMIPGRQIKALYFLKESLGSEDAKANSSKQEDPGRFASREYLLSQELWVGTDEGCYLQQGQAFRRIPDQSQSVNGLIFVNGHPWVSTDKGVYRVDRDVSLKLDVRSEEWWWKSIVEAKWFLPNVLRVSGTATPVPYYARTSDNSDYRNYCRDCLVIMEMNQVDRELTTQYASPNDIVRPLRPWRPVVYYSIRDRWGNTVNDHMALWVVPGPVQTGILLGVGWALSLVLIIAFAPTNSFCFGLLMNRHVRKIGYFNLVPIVIALLPPVRLHILRRYREGLRNDKSLAEWKDRFVVPSAQFAPSRLLEVFRGHRKIILLGQSGIGKTSYFKYLLSVYLSDAKSSSTISRLTPVFLPLRRYIGSQPLQMIHTQLASYGQLTDEELNLSLLERGGFLILFDGLNEIDADTRNSLNTFIERHWTTNYFFISSQEDYPEFAGERLQLATLNRDGIHELLEKRLGAERAHRIVKSLDAGMYEIYKIPQELELAIELLIDDPERLLPRSRRELYERKLDPIFRKWETDGHTDYMGRLMERSYQMIKSLESSFDPQSPKAPLPPQIKSDLLKRGFLVLRSDQYNFRHEQIGAFLAARYFAPRWRELLNDQSTIDFNWQQVVKFSIPYLEGKEEIRDLYLTLIEKNKFLAIDLFRWLSTTKPALSEGWESWFKRELGEAMVNESHQA